MILIVIGQSASGKTTFVKSRFIKAGARVIKDAGTGLDYTVCGETAVIGRYDTGKRCEGTDLFSFTCQAGVLSLIDTLALNYSTIVVEGDRVTNKRVVAEICAKYPSRFSLVLCKCSVEKSMARRAAGGSDPNEKFVKTTGTKAFNIFRKYAWLANTKIEIET